FSADIGLTLAVFLSTLNGKYILEGNLYDSPWTTINELLKFDLNIKVDREQKKLYIAPSQLKNTPAEIAEEESYPLPILLAALIAEGKSTIYYTDRLNYHFEDVLRKLKGLEADIHDEIIRSVATFEQK
ncbi:MAG: hypothetical protein JXR30_01845, partial [Alphaproteobacteria bacterium]|nr:hypothetical protein [Alphaproteobacteria bacterium]